MIQMPEHDHSDVPDETMIPVTCCEWADDVQDAAEEAHRVIGMTTFTGRMQYALEGVSVALRDEAAQLRADGHRTTADDLDRRAFLLECWSPSDPEPTEMADWVTWVETSRGEAQSTLREVVG